MRMDMNPASERTQAVAQLLEHAYGDCAATYAGARAEAAAKRGASGASGQWKDIEASIHSDTDDDEFE